MRRQPVTSAVLPSRRNRSGRDINFSSTVQARAGMVPLRIGRCQREARTGQGKESRMLCKSLVTAAITLRWVLLVAQSKIATVCAVAILPVYCRTCAFAVSNPRPARHHRLFTVPPTPPLRPPLKITWKVLFSPSGPMAMTALPLSCFVAVIRPSALAFTQPVPAAANSRLRHPERELALRRRDIPVHHEGSC